MTGDLPGGLWERGERRRRFTLRPVTGRLELAVAEAVEAAPSLPAAVTGTLALSVASLGGLPATRERVAALCVPDRTYLLARTLAQLGQGSRWHQATCSACGDAFDFHLDLTELPASAAPAGYPFARVRLGAASVRFRLPTGGDEEALAAMDEAEASPWELARRCWMGPASDARVWRRIRALGDEGLGRIEDALEAVAPGVPGAVAARCPQCQHQNEVGLELHSSLEGRVDALLLEVDQIAAHYHWGEAEILRMPRRRRQRYLSLVDGARGMAS